MGAVRRAVAPLVTLGSNLGGSDWSVAPLRSRRFPRPSRSPRRCSTVSPFSARRRPNRSAAATAADDHGHRTRLLVQALGEDGACRQGDLHGQEQRASSTTASRSRGRRPPRSSRARARRSSSPSPRPGRSHTRRPSAGDAAKGMKGMFTTKTHARPAMDVSAGKADLQRERAAAACHTLQAAGSTGTIGPNLDRSTATLATIVMRITAGKGVMQSYAGTLLRAADQRRGELRRRVARRDVAPAWAVRGRSRSPSPPGSPRRHGHRAAARSRPFHAPPASRVS